MNGPAPRGTHQSKGGLCSHIFAEPEKIRTGDVVKCTECDNEVTFVHVLLPGKTRNPIASKASLDTCAMVGFGASDLLRNGRYVESMEHPRRRFFRRGDRMLTLRDAERYARKHPGTYELRMNAPLWSATFRRVRPGKWLVTEAGEGFA